MTIRRRPALRPLPALALALALASLAGCSDESPTEGARISSDTHRLFRDRCALCHGIDGRGTPMSRGAADFNDAAWRESARMEDLIGVITQGRGEMRGFSEVLTAEEIAELADAIKHGDIPLFSSIPSAAFKN